MKSLIILGSTGSIGTQALEVCERQGYKVNALAAGGNIELLEKQARKLFNQLNLKDFHLSYHHLVIIIRQTTKKINNFSETNEIFLEEMKILRT